MSSIEAITGNNSTEYTSRTGTTTTTQTTGMDFSAMLADTMKEEMTRMSLTAGTGTSEMPGGYMPMQMQSQGIEEMILAAASSGQVTDAQAALYMLCMMMQNSQDSDFSMVMQMMASLLTKIQDDSGSLRETTMSSGYDPYVLDQIDANVFGTNMPNYSGAWRATLPTEFWRPATPVLTGSEDNRSPELYTAVISQFRVETAERYRPFRNGSTYCNIYAWDVTSAMGAEIPHYTDPQTGAPLKYPDVKGAKSMTAIEMDKWLKTYGADYGWREVDAETAQLWANEGKPAVASGGRIDHIQVVCPSRNGDFDPARGVTIAQAGSKVTSYAYISSIYGTGDKDYVSYFIHD